MDRVRKCLTEIFHIELHLEEKGKEIIGEFFCDKSV
jgi:hypothetical protein